MKTKTGKKFTVGDYIPIDTSTVQGSSAARSPLVQVQYVTKYHTCTVSYFVPGMASSTGTADDAFNLYV